MKSIDEILIESEKESFKAAAKVAKDHHTQLVFWENGHLVKRTPTPNDLMGTDIKEIQIP
ncbi:MAG: hypothetical protein ACHQUC_09635 [Chlamydiales bacterium]